MHTDLEFIDKLERGLVAINQIQHISYCYNSRELVFQCDKVKLYHYKSQAKKLDIPPLLIVFATVNRPEILDLFPNSSLIGGLLRKGIDVYLLDWGYPDKNDHQISFTDYVVKYLKTNVDFICRQHYLEQINLLGVCQGGVISICHSILSSTIKNIILISTPIDFHVNNNVIGELIKKVNVKQNENISGKGLTQFFISLRPFELLGKKYLRFLDNVDNEERTHKFLLVEKWLHDAPDQPHHAFITFIDEFYRANKLIQGELIIDNQKINLKQLTVPILNIVAKEDEIIPIESSIALKKYVGTKDYSVRTFPSGHIGIYVSERVGNRLSSTITNWLKAR